MTRSAPYPAAPASRRLAALLAHTTSPGVRRSKADPGGWMPTSAEAPANAPLVNVPLGRRCGPASGTRISADLGSLAVRMVATASATYARMGLGSIEARILSTLGAGPQTASQIGKVLGIDRAAVFRAAQGLIDRGLVLKLDGKARALSLTQDGARLIVSINRVQAERERRILAGFSEAETAELLGFLGRLMLNVPELVELAESGAFGSEIAET